jgi:uncharacterized protein (DUF952 family)
VKARWLYHALPRLDWERVGAVYAPESLAREGFVHASHRDRIAESARLYVAPSGPCVVLRIDPRRIPSRIEIAATPRGPMPHVRGAIPREAIVEATPLEAWNESEAPDAIA